MQWPCATLSCRSALATRQAPRDREKPLSVTPSRPNAGNPPCAAGCAQHNDPRNIARRSGYLGRPSCVTLVLKAVSSRRPESPHRVRRLSAGWGYSRATGGRSGIGVPRGEGTKGGRRSPCPREEGCGWAVGGGRCACGCPLVEGRTEREWCGERGAVPVGFWRGERLSGWRRGGHARACEGWAGAGRGGDAIGAEGRRGGENGRIGTESSRCHGVLGSQGHRGFVGLHAHQSAQEQLEWRGILAVFGGPGAATASRPHARFSNPLAQRKPKETAADLELSPKQRVPRRHG
jgi:hypothetical protein